MSINKLNSKAHYPILDGLRGVASITVVCFHILETHSISHADQIINHGYLAVDFFFLLSGFVIGYAYDDRWQHMSISDFFKRRLIRLQPMVIMGMIVGAILFYFQDSAIWSHIHEVPLWKMLLVMLIGFTLLPVPQSMDIRGWQEMHPLNGPGWSLFYEYIANILYALFVRKFSKTLLSILVVIFAGFLLFVAISSKEGDVIGGWSLDLAQIKVGFARLLYPFFGGLLLFRTVKIGKINNAFFLASIVLLMSLAFPRVVNANNLWLNGIYDSLTIIFIFPLIVYFGASGNLNGEWAAKICKFLGDISYPIYITHYPIIYLYTAWISDHKYPISQAYPVALLVLASSIAFAYICLKYYDEPVRKYLNTKYLGKS